MKNLDYKRIYKHLDNNKNSLLLTREGSGKSAFAEFLVNHLRKVIFLSPTNKQAEAQFQTFQKSYKIKAQLIKSRSRKLQDIGIIPKMVIPRDKFDFPFIDEEDAFKQISKQYGSSNIKSIWNSTIADEFVLDSDAHIICATFAQINQIHHFSSDSYVVIFDDPERFQVSDFHMVSDKYVRESENSSTEIIVSEVIPGTMKYFAKRPIKNKLNYNVQLPILYTTTEELTSKLIEKNLNATTIDERHNLEEGEIYIFSTDVTRKRDDWLIPFFSQHLNNLGYDNTLIGDGLKLNEFNHVNSKGNNNFMDTHTLIELSWPALDRIFELMPEFPEYNQYELEEQLLLDQLHQALGRNQGYRHRGKSAFVLIDKHYATRVCKRLQYKNHIHFKTKEQRMFYPTDNKMFWEVHRFLIDPKKFMITTLRGGATLLYEMIEQMHIPEKHIESLIESANKIKTNEYQKRLIKNALLMKMNKGKI